MILLGAVSVLFSVAIILIPFIASRLVRGDVGSTVFAILSAVGFYANATTKALVGSSASSQSLSAGPPSAIQEPGPPTGSGTGSVGMRGEEGALMPGSGATLSESKPPASLGTNSSAGLTGSAGELGAEGAVLAV
jgi:hypothetical protein